jgi:predicted esterase
LFIPDDYDPAVEYPIILALHGSGQSGTDNESHIMTLRMATSWAEPALQSQWPAFVVAPQSPGAAWAFASNFSPLPPIQDANQAALNILDSLILEFNIDLDRLYLTGLSTGSFGIWDLALRYPDRFAAIVPIAGGANPALVDRLGQLSIWIFHGEADTVTPTAISRSIIEALEDIGRSALFTNCSVDPSQCSPVSSDVFEAAMDAHDNLIYTGYPGLGHVSEVPLTAYGDPRLTPWVFSQHRRPPDGIQITHPASGAVWSGEQSIRWNVAEPTESGELWVSTDNDRSWSLLDASVGNTGQLTFDTATVDETPFARVRLVFFEPGGLVLRVEESETFTIDNPGNGPPFVEIDTRPFYGQPTLEDELFTLMVTAIDPEGQPLQATVGFSSDGGATFRDSMTRTLESSTASQPVSIDLADLANTTEAMIRVSVSDGERESEHRTPIFTKASQRVTSEAVTRISGNGRATVRVNWVDPAALTGHRYRINFNDARPVATAFSVTDQNTGQVVLDNAPVSDGTLESQDFDGIRLIVEVDSRSTVNLDSTGWRTGGVDSQVTITSPVVGLDGELVEYLATRADYRITITADIVDMSQALFGMEAVPMRFTVENITVGELRPVLFEDVSNGDGIPNSRRLFKDRIHILEDDGTGSLAPAWRLEFFDGTTLPEAGDEFVFQTYGLASEADVFEFEAVVGLAKEENVIPTGIESLLGYPNPFAVATTIQYSLSAPSMVTVEIYNLVGRRVGQIDHGYRASGLQSVRWQPVSVQGERFPAGVYFARLAATDPGGSRSMKVVSLVLLR